MLHTDLMNEVELGCSWVRKELSQVAGSSFLVFENSCSKVMHLLCGKISNLFFVGEVNSNV